MGENNKWEPVIGLEIHVQLNTKAKLFSSAYNRFGDEPNTNITEVCTGQPGALPVINIEALRHAILFGLAIDAKIASYTTFDRKSYFYPDSPRNFQITQYENPIIAGGRVTANVDGVMKTFQIHHAHLEDDAGMLKHFSSFAGVDYNRAGTALIEIVSEPTMHSPKEASSYAMAIKSIMQYLDVSDCNMEEGSLRFDINISVRRHGEKKLRGKTEIKNLNSFAFLEEAAALEIKRQIEIYEKNSGQEIDTLIKNCTFRYDSAAKKLLQMRVKESAEDYRYFPEPDLTPVYISEEVIEAIKKKLPELPAERLRRYIEKLSLSEYSAAMLVNDKRLADYFEEGLKYTANARGLCNWITVEFFGRLKEANLDLFQLSLPAGHIGRLVDMIDKGKITGKIAKSIADDMVGAPHLDPEEIVKNNPDYSPISDPKVIGPVIDEVLKENSASVSDFKKGKEKAYGYLVGQVMKRSHGKFNPDVVNEILRRRLA